MYSFFSRVYGLVAGVAGYPDSESVIDVTDGDIQNQDIAAVKSDLSSRATDKSSHVGKTKIISGI